MTRRMTVLHLQDPKDEALWRAALASHNAPSVSVDRGEDIVERVRSDARLSGAGALVVDAPVLAPQGLTASTLSRRLKRVNPGLAVFLRTPGKPHVSARERSWAREAGLAGLFPGSSPSRWRESLAPAVGELLEHLGRGPLHAERIGDFLRVLDVRDAHDADGALDEAYAATESLAALGLEPAAVLEALREVEVKDRSYRATTYRQCFVASEGVERLATELGLRRPAAIAAGRALQALGAIHHVVREKAFDNAFLYFRFACDRGAGAAPDLGRLLADLRSPRGVEVADRTYLGKSYPRCFVGTEAVDWLMDHAGMSVGAAEAAGQAMLELGLIRHVVDEHPFLDAGYYYNFVPDSA